MTLSDANREQAQLCAERARQALQRGDAAAARRMLAKAQKLDATGDWADLISQIDATEASSSSTSTTGNSASREEANYAHDDHYDNPAEEGVRQRSSRPSHKGMPHSASTGGMQNGAAAAGGSGEPSSVRSRSKSAPRLGRDFTQEQLQLVNRIKKCKDYYEILGVPKNADEAVLKREYRKLSLKLHPDKCHVPDAADAFKALGNAYAVLSDEEKRRRYDDYVASGGERHASHNHHHQRGSHFEYDYSHGFEADYTAEEIFNMFFGGQFPGEHVRRRRQAHFHHQQYEQPDADRAYTALLQLLPLFLIVILAMLAQFMAPEPAFSLHQTKSYTEARMTSRLHVTYWVKSDFSKNYGLQQIRQVENQVEDEWIQQMRMKCYQEKTTKESAIYRGRLYRDEEMIRRGEKMKTPACDRLNEIYA